MASTSSPTEMPQRAFTLIELLVTIGIMGILVAILLPALSNARASARQVACLSNLHGIGSVLSTYHAAYADVFPFAAVEQVLDMDPPDEGGGRLYWTSPWKLVFYWPAVMHSTAPWREHFGAWVCPGASRDSARPWRAESGYGDAMSSYHYVRSFQAAPALWLPDTHEDPALLRCVRVAELQFPASKVVYFDHEMAHAITHDRRSPIATCPMLFGDSHATAYRRNDATPPVGNAYVDTPEALHDTPGGAGGRDY
jgi:prepilin-type N-terminal cleavage/methylation domain-containing protein